MEVTRMAVKTKLQLIVEQLRLATAELKADNDKAELQQQQQDYDQYLVDTAPITLKILPSILKLTTGYASLGIVSGICRCLIISVSFVLLMGWYVGLGVEEFVMPIQQGGCQVQPWPWHRASPDRFGRPE